MVLHVGCAIRVIALNAHRWQASRCCSRRRCPGADSCYMYSHHDIACPWTLGCRTVPLAGVQVLLQTGNVLVQRCSAPRRGCQLPLPLVPLSRSFRQRLHSNQVATLRFACLALFCIVLHCTVLHCFALHSFVGASSACLCFGALFSHAGLTQLLAADKLSAGSAYERYIASVSARYLLRLGCLLGGPRGMTIVVHDRCSQYQR